MFKLSFDPIFQNSLKETARLRSKMELPIKKSEYTRKTKTHVNNKMNDTLFKNLFYIWLYKDERKQVLFVSN